MYILLIPTSDPMSSIALAIGLEHMRTEDGLVRITEVVEATASNGSHEL